MYQRGGDAMKILILDDDKELLSALRRVLESNDHDVAVSDNAKAALPMAEQNDYDLLLVDYKMPDNDGMWFMRNVRLPKKSRVVDYGFCEPRCHQPHVRAGRLRVPDQAIRRTGTPAPH
jgi:CheY-like chemotaxis protein